MSISVDVPAKVQARRFHLLGFSSAQAWALVALLVLIVVCPSFIYPINLMRVLCFALFACAFNLLIGFVGLMSFGHAAYFGMGGYVAAWAAKTWGFTPELAILLGGITAALLGCAFGALAIRRQGIYFAMITLALGEMVYFFCKRASFTGGEDGIQGIPRGDLFGLISLKPDMTLYVVVVAVFLSGFLLIHRIVHSPFGQVLKAIRENEPRATSLGYRTDSYKLIAFILSAGFAGIAGGLNSVVVGLATLTNVENKLSGEVVLMALMGGMGTVFGPVVGAAIFVATETALSGALSWVKVLQGLIFVVCVMAFRRGVVGEIGHRLRIAL